MSQPLIATHRVEYQYVVSGKTHKQRIYCQLGTPVGGVQKIVCRDGVTTLDWDVAAQGGWNDMTNILDINTSGSSMLLQERSGIVWNPIASAAGTGVGQMTGIKLASQCTFVLRDTAFKFMRYEVMEQAVGWVGHSNTGYGIHANVDLLADAITGQDADPTGLYQWMKSRGDRFLLGVGCIAGATLDLNDKIKRARGLA